MNHVRWQLVKQNLFGNKRFFIGAIIAATLAVFTELLSPLILRLLIDSVIGNEPVAQNFTGLGWLLSFFGGRDNLRSRLWLVGILWVGIALVEGVASYLRGRWTATGSENFTKALRNRLFNHLQHLPYNYHVKAETGDLIQRCTSDVDTLRRFLAGQLVEVFRTVVMLIAALTIMFNLSARMTVVSLIVMPVLFFFSFLYFRMVMKYFRASDEAEGAMSATLQENLTGVRVVRAFGRERFEQLKFAEKNDECLRLNKRLMRLLAFYWAFSDFLAIMQSTLVMCFGVYMAIQQPGIYTAGLIAAFMMYVSKMLWPIRQLGRILGDFGKALVSIDRLNDILLKPGEADETNGETPPLNKDIVFDKVGFKYDGSHQVLDDLSFTVKAGSTVAILGATGSGKSTMMYLLQRLYEPTEGKITIGGVPVNRIRKDYLRSRVGIVLQEPFLYSKRIRENIAIANPEMPDEEVFSAARTAAVHDVILDFEKGYDTEVGERGVTLSGGQKQRVAIARTLARENDIIIFDDSLSAVDTETDAAIRSQLKKRGIKATTFIISHRITTLSEADTILVLENGHIVQQGSHEELIGREGLYSRIHNIQNTLETELSEEVGQGEGRE